MKFQIFDDNPVVASAIETLFPKGNYYMYGLYLSFCVMIPLLTMCLFLILSIMDNGLVISTDSFYAVQTMPTSGWSENVPSWFFKLANDIGVWLWVALVLHTTASLGFDTGRKILEE